ncbi:EpsG family protein [Providencia rettgeri]
MESSILYKNNKQREHTKKNSLPFILFVFSAFVVFFFIGFRGDVNTDWSTYQSHYYNLDSEKLNFGPEFLFWFSMWLTKSLGFSYPDFILISSLINIMLIIIIFKNEKYRILALILYLVFSGGLGFRLDFNLQRNIKSILLFAFSIRYIESRQFGRYALVNIIGSFFHITSLLYLPLYFILNKKISTKFLYIIFLGGNIVYIANLQWLSTFISFISIYLPERLNYLAVVYSESEIFNQSKQFSAGYIEKNLLFLSAILFYKKTINLNEKYTEISANLVFIFCFIQMYCSDMIIITDRLALLFLPGFWFYYCRVYASLSYKSKAYFIVVLLLFIAMKHFAIPSPSYLKYETIIFSDY